MARLTSRTCPNCYPGQCPEPPFYPLSSPPRMPEQPAGPLRWIYTHQRVFWPLRGYYEASRQSEFIELICLEYVTCPFSVASLALLLLRVTLGCH
jgi:hypothetical protein